MLSLRLGSYGSRFPDLKCGLGAVPMVVLVATEVGFLADDNFIPAFLF